MASAGFLCLAAALAISLCWLGASLYGARAGRREYVDSGRRAVYAPHAQATERMVPTTDGEIARKRRMMSHSWATVLRGGMLGPRGYPPLYAWMLFSHRLLRYSAPALRDAPNLPSPLGVKE